MGYKMIRTDIHCQPTSWNVRLCTIDDGSLCLRLIPVFFTAYRLPRLLLVYVAIISSDPSLEMLRNNDINSLISVVGSSVPLFRRNSRKLSTLAGIDCYACFSDYLIQGSLKLGSSALKCLESDRHVTSVRGCVFSDV